MMNTLSLRDVNELGHSIYERSLKDPTLKAQVDTLNTFEVYEFSYKATNQNSTNIGIVGLDKKTGDVVQFHPDGKQAPILLFTVKSKEQFLTFINEQQRKGVDVKRIR